MPSSGRATAPATPTPQAWNEASARRTPSEKSRRGIDISPSMRMAVSSGGHNASSPALTPMPASAASMTGMRQTVDSRVRWSSIQAPSEKCNRFSTKNSTTAAGSAASPKASTASGNPMLPELLNIIGGRKVFASTFMSRASGQAASPDPSTTAAAPTASAQ